MGGSTEKENTGTTNQYALKLNSLKETPVKDTISQKGFKPKELTTHKSI